MSVSLSTVTSNSRAQPAIMDFTKILFSADEVRGSLILGVHGNDFEGIKHRRDCVRLHDVARTTSRRRKQLHV